MPLRPVLAVLLATALTAVAALAAPAEGSGLARGRAPITTVARDPYLGAIVVDAKTGQVLREDNADAKGYPASVTKLMDLLVILDRIQAGKMRLEDPVPVSVTAAKTGGSQVYLDPRETFTVDEMLYALMVQSANDSAVALAEHVAGSTQGFVTMMNQKAQQIGMRNTVFQSVHGLPPGEGQQPDVTTPRDLALLCRALLAYPDTLRYTSVYTRPFRPASAKPFGMRNHNGLLKSFPGCDGLKTGYFTAGGFSIAATAQRDGNRVIAIVMGSTNIQTRDAKTSALLGEGLAKLATMTPPAPPAPATQQAGLKPQPGAKPAQAQPPAQPTPSPALVPVPANTPPPQQQQPQPQKKK